MSETMRIQRALARAGVASRRHAEELVAAGRVLVNGAVAVVGQPVDPETDEILVDGKRLHQRPWEEWFVLNKPAGVMTTRADPEGRRTVFDLVPPVPGLTYVGRLDLLTEGVLLLTTDGATAHRLSHPSSEIEREYVATVRGPAMEAARLAMEGVELEDGIAQPVRAHAESLGDRRWAFHVVLTEGRKREVRRLCTALGLEVERLVRTSFGPVKLGALEPGEVRRLTPQEQRALGVEGTGPTEVARGSRGEGRGAKVEGRGPRGEGRGARGGRRPPSRPERGKAPAKRAPSKRRRPPGDR